MRLLRNQSQPRWLCHILCESYSCDRSQLHEECGIRVRRDHACVSSAQFETSPAYRPVPQPIPRVNLSPESGVKQMNFTWKEWIEVLR